jgi:hypothetical protein
MPGGVHALHAPVTVPETLFKVSRRRMNRCMMLEFDVAAQRWKDALYRTPARGVLGAQVFAAALAQAPHAADRKRLTPTVRPDRSQSGSGSRPAPTRDPSALWIGLLLAVCPPMGVTLAWSSNEIPRDGKIALTCFGALMMVVAALFGLAIVTHR